MLEAGPEPNGEDPIEDRKKRVLKCIEWRTAIYSTLRAQTHAMKDEEYWCLRWLGTDNVKKALHPEFLDEVLTKKYVAENQQVADKRKGVVDEEVEAVVDIGEVEEIYEHDIEEATRRSLA